MKIEIEYKNGQIYITAKIKLAAGRLPERKT